MGVPNRTSTAIDKCCIALLESAGIKPDIIANTTKDRSIAEAFSARNYDEYFNQRIRSMMADSGATGNLNHSEERVEGAMINPQESIYTIAVAKDGECI